VPTLRTNRYPSFPRPADYDALPWPKAASPLYLIALGGLIWVLDIRLNFQATDGMSSIDLLHDAAGMALMGLGLGRLAALDKRWGFRMVMLVLATVCAGFLLWLAVSQFRPTRPMPVPVLAPLAPLGVLVAAASFALAMQRAFGRRGLMRSAQEVVWFPVLFCFALFSPGAIVGTLALLARGEDQPSGQSIGVTALIATIHSTPFAALLLIARRLERSKAAALQQSHDGQVAH
jgi:hypothetical protein